MIEESGLAMNKWWRAFLVAFICVVGCAAYYRFVVATASVELEIEVQGETDFRIFWATEDQHYSDTRMSRVKVHPGKTQYSFYLTDISKVSRLRIDPFAYKGKALIKKLSFQQEGVEEIQLLTGADFENLSPLNQIKKGEMSDEGFVVKSTGNDPYFEMVVEAKPIPLNSSWLLWRMMFIAATLILFMYFGSSLIQQFRFVPLLLFGAWLLIIVMAGISKINAHPDEYVHMYATSYYHDHWLPPQVDDPAIRNTYSVYGISRLNSGGVYYLLAGKYEKMMHAFHAQKPLSKRLFNITLFGLILLYTIRNRAARLVAIPLLLTPQIWYVFSYCTSDGFAVAVAFFAACQLVDSDSLLQRFLKGGGWGVSILSILGVGLLLGLLFLLKKNYYPFIAFFYFCAVVKLLFTEQYYWDRKQAVLRFGLVTLLGLAIFGVRIGADYQVNGMDRQQKLRTLQEDLAHYKYKPSTPLENKNISIHRKARGTTFKEMFVVHNWGEKTFQSSFGVFGYMNITGSQMFYDMVRYTSFGLLAFVFCSIVLRGGWLGGSMAISAGLLSVALIAVSAYSSWTIDFQSQGRYLFPIAAMAGIVYGLYHKTVNSQLLTFGVICMYILSCYNFIFNGLVYIPKIPI